MKFLHVKQSEFMALFILAQVLVISLQALGSERKTFGISSFIPERFTDTEWRVQGSTNFSYDDASNEESENNYYNFERSGAQWSAVGQLDFYSIFRYRKITVPKSLIISINGSANYNWQNNHSNTTYMNLDGLSEAYSSSNRHNQFTVAVLPSCDLIRYIKGDIFASIVANGVITYHKSPRYEGENTKKGQDYFPPSYIHEYYRHNSVRIDEDGKSYTISVTLLPGFGRKYEGRYAATALYIIDELRKANLLQSEPDSNQMLQLCNIIYQQSNQHAVDSRIHLIESLGRIIDYLTDEGIFIDNKSTGCLTIQDVWNYYPRYPRSFGLLIRGGIGFDGSYQSQQNGTTRFSEIIEDVFLPDSGSYFGYPREERTIGYDYYRFIFKKTAIRSEVRIDYSRPISLNWQLDVNYQVSYFLYSKLSNESDEIYSAIDGNIERLETYKQKDNVYTEVFTNLQYIINSRSEFRQNLRFSYMHMRVERAGNQVGYDDNYNFPNWSITNDFELQLGVMFNYRVSIPTTLSLAANYSSLWQIPYENKHSRNSYFSFSLGVAHYIF